MALLKKLEIGLGIDLSGLDAQVNRAAEVLNGLPARVAPVHLSAAAGAGAAAPAAARAVPDAGADVAALGAKVRSAVAPAMAAVEQMGRRVVAQLDVIGGAVVVLFRRIDAQMKAPAFDRFLDAVRNQMPAAFLKGAVDAYRTLHNLHSLWANLGDVAGKSLSQIKGFKAAGLDRAAADARKLGPAFASARPPVQALKASVTGLGREIAIALGVFGLVSKVVGFFKGGIEGAVRLNETVSATRVTFGAAAAGVEAFADDLAARFGVVKNEALTVSNGFGDFAQAAGLGAAASADFALRMGKLTGDLMSFKDVPFAEAAANIRSALAGEAEPLRKFGVLVTESAVASYALSHGLAASKDELTEGAKVQARAALIAEGLGKANGDLERTAGSAANQFRKAGGGLENFATAIGSALMPAVEVAVGGFNELLASVVEAFTAARPYVEAFVAGLVSGFNVAFDVIRNYDLAWQLAVIKFREGGMNMLAALAVIPENLAIIGEYLANNWVRIVVDGVNAVGTAFTNLSSNLQALGAAIFEWMSDPTQGFRFNWTPLLDGFQATVDKFPDLARPVWADLSEEAGKVWEEWDRRRAAREKALGKPGAAAAKAAAAAAAPAKAAKEAEVKLASAAELNSKEAYSAVSRNQANGLRDPAKEGVKVARDHLQEAKKQTAILERQNRPAAAPPAVVVRGF